jgi:hypothetical protein
MINSLGRLKLEEELGQKIKLLLEVKGMKIVKGLKLGIIQVIKSEIEFNNITRKLGKIKSEDEDYKSIEK